MIRCYNFEVYTESLDGIIRYRKVRATRACRADGKGRAAKGMEDNRYRTSI